MKTRVTILASETREFTGKTGKKNTTFICQCVVHGEKVEVGVLRLREALVPGYVEGQAPVTPIPGDYLAEFGLQVAWDTKELGGTLKSLTPMTGTNAAKSVADVVAGKDLKEPAKA